MFLVIQRDALCNLTSLKFGGGRKTPLWKRRRESYNMKMQPTRKKRDKRHLRHFSFFFLSKQSPIFISFSFPSSRYYQLGALSILFDLFYPFIICPPEFTIFYCHLKIEGGRGDFNSHIFNHFSRSEYSFQDRCTHQKSPTVFCLPSSL